MCVLLKTKRRVNKESRIAEAQDHLAQRTKTLVGIHRNTDVVIPWLISALLQLGWGGAFPLSVCVALVGSPSTFRKGIMADLPIVVIDDAKTLQVAVQECFSVLTGVDIAAKLTKEEDATVETLTSSTPEVIVPGIVIQATGGEEVLHRVQIGRAHV